MRFRFMKSLVVFILGFFLFSGCIKNNENPSWIEINTWKLNFNPDIVDDQGELTHNFTDAWIYADGQLVGVFELPVKLPILKEGATHFKILPAIHNNGISATKKAYPFVEAYELDVNLVRDEKIVINPETKYYSNVKFWIEDFEDASIKFVPDPTSTAILMAENDPTILKYGLQYGAVHLTTENSTFYAYNSDSDNLLLPKQGAQVYLEVDYRSSNSLVTGVIEVSPATIKNHPNVQMNAQDISGPIWKKIYIDMQEIVTGTPNAEYYKISLSALLDDGGINRDIIVDNIKVIYF
ncbi:MAG: hypothetical protein WC044_11315 [Crocinitomicaceae bacterium]